MSDPAGRELELLPETLVVCRLDPGAELPAAPETGFWSVTRSEQETSWIGRSQDAPPSARREGPFRGLRIAGTLDFSLVGVLAALCRALADAGLSVFALSTFDTDYLLVRSEDLDRALAVLAAAGFPLSGTGDG